MQVEDKEEKIKKSASSKVYAANESRTRRLLGCRPRCLNPLVNAACKSQADLVRKSSLNFVEL